MTKRSQASALAIHGVNSMGDAAPASIAAISDIAEADAAPMAPVDITGSFAPGNGGNPRYSAKGLPPGTSISVLGIIAGTPVGVAVYPVSVTLVTNFGFAKSPQFNFTVS